MITAIKIAFAIIIGLIAVYIFFRIVFLAIAHSWYQVMNSCQECIKHKHEPKIKGGEIK